MKIKFIQIFVQLNHKVVDENTQRWLNTELGLESTGCPALIGLATCLTIFQRCFCLWTSWVLSNSSWYFFLSIIALSLAWIRAFSRAYKNILILVYVRKSKNVPFQSIPNQKLTLSQQLRIDNIIGHLSYRNVVILINVKHFLYTFLKK